MCGIAGIISFKAENISELILKNMCRSLTHRGPDGEGIFLDNGESVSAGFSHRRLAIIDHSTNANQPLIYQDRFVVVHNGEIYNYEQIKSALIKNDYRFLSGGDTEVIAAAYAHYGEACIDHFNGMFAFAIWDIKEKKLFCARDRFGEKPFYYHYDSRTGSLYFASEMKALFAAGIEKKINMHLMHGYLSLGITKSSTYPEQTFYQNIFSLQPAHKMVYEPLKDSIYSEKYWDLDKETKTLLDEKHCIEKFNTMLSDSILLRTKSDVSYGSTLSGGIDSASIAMLLASSPNEYYSRKTFSSVFPNFINNEQQKIEILVNKIRLDPVYIFPDEKNLVDEFEKMMYHQEEPINSSSVFAQFKVFESAKNNNIKVLLDGQGADEILGGYIKYSKWYLQEIIRTKGLKTANKEALELTNYHFLNEWGFKEKFSAFTPLATKFLLERKAKHILKKDPWLTQDFKREFDVSEHIFKPEVRKLNDILYADTMVYGLEELLRYADRNSMAHGCEVRLPFLDHKLVEFIFSIPATLKFKNGWNKWILRNFINGNLPDPIVWQKGKIGFETPQEQWLNDSRMKEKIMEGRRLMIQEGIYKKEVLNTPFKIASVHDANNFDWRCISASTLLS